MYFSRCLFVNASSDEKQELCQELSYRIAEIVQGVLAGKPELEGKLNEIVGNVVDDLRKVGHEMTCWAESPDNFEEWGYNLYDNEAYGLIINIALEDDVTVSWKDSDGVLFESVSDAGNRFTAADKQIREASKKITDRNAWVGLYGFSKIFTSKVPVGRE